MKEEKDYAYLLVIWLSISIALISLFDGMLRDNLQVKSEIVKCK